MYITLAKHNFLKVNPDIFLFSYVINGSRLSMRINKSAFEILRLCDGTNTLDVIYQELKNKYNEEMEIVKNNVDSFLEPLINNKLVEKINIPMKREIVKGSKEIFIPDSISWEITDICPLRCRHCYLINKGTMVLQEKEIDYLVDSFRDIGLQTLQITGGEIFTYPLLEILVRKIIEIRPNIILSTSGYILNDHVIEVLKLIKEVNGGVRISIDGLEVTHNRIRNKNDAYERSINFIKKAIELGVTCQVATTLSNQSEEEVEEVVKTMKALGVSFHVISVVSMQGNAEINQIENFYDQEKLKVLLDKLSKKYVDEKYKIQMPVETKEINCGAGYKMLRIRANLDVTPCPMNDIVLGNLRKETIQTIMGRCGKAYRSIISPNVSICDGCKKAAVCKKCMANALENYKSVPTCSWYEQNKDKLMVEK